MTTTGELKYEEQIGNISNSYAHEEVVRVVTGFRPEFDQIVETKNGQREKSPSIKNKKSKRNKGK